MLLYTLYWLAVMEAFLVTSQADEKFLKPSGAEKIPNTYDSQEQGVLTNELDDEPKFASAYPTLPNEDAKTPPSVPVGKEDQLNLQDSQGMEFDHDSYRIQIRLGLIKTQSDLVSSPMFKQLQKLRDLSGELKHLAHHIDGVADQDSEEQYEPHLFVSVPLSLQGMEDIKDILDVALFDPLQSLFNGSFSLGKGHDNQQSGGRSKRTPPTNAMDSTAPFETTSHEENLKPTTVDEEMPYDEDKMLEFMKSLKQSLDEKTAILNKNQEMLEDVAFSASVLQHIASLPSVQASYENARLTYNNFLLTTKPQPVSFHETHEGNQVYRHGPTGIFFGTILAKGAQPGQQRAGDDDEDSVKIKGDFQNEPQTATPIPLLAELMKNLDKLKKNPVDVGRLFAAILRYADSAVEAESQDALLKNRKLRSGVILEPKGEL